MSRLSDEFIDDMAKLITRTIKKLEEQGINVFKLVEVKGSDTNEIKL